jgi:hypothetical protein
MIRCRNHACSFRRNIIFVFLFLTISYYESVVRAYLIPQRASISSRSSASAERSAASKLVSFAKNSRLSDLSNFGASDFDELEQEVFASTRAQMDMQRVKRTITEQDSSSPMEADPQKTAIMAAQWKISLAAASFASTFFLIATHSSLPITGVVFAAVFFVANQDPLEEEGAAGALARLLGRFTIQSVETTKPKLKAMARAAITSETEDQKQIVSLLEQRIEVLEQENNKLKQWKKQRSSADTLLSQYGLDELKDMARDNHLPVGGTKIQLLMRLLENRVLIPM